MLARLQKLKESRSCLVVTAADASRARAPPKRTFQSFPRVESQRCRNGLGGSVGPKHEFPTDKDDHCETSDVAYDDIVPLLNQLASLWGKSPKNLKIYDPYYCNGAVIRHLASRGFPQVYNKNEDFYRVIREQKVPEYDVCVTNPPFSGDHIEKILQFCADSKKPFFCLVPNYVYTKPFYNSIFQECRPFYVIPEKRYEFWTPGGFRKASVKEKKTSPFVSFWYCHGGAQTAHLIGEYRKFERAGASSGAEVIQTLRLLPQRVRATFDPKRKRLRKKQRVAMKRRASSLSVGE